MSAIFISHSSLDNAVAADLATRLRTAGYQSLFLDFDPAEGIPPVETGSVSCSKRFSSVGLSSYCVARTQWHRTGALLKSPMPEHWQGNISRHNRGL